MNIKKDNIKIFKLGEIATVKGRIGWKGLKKDDYVANGFPILTSYNLVDQPGGLDYSIKINRVPTYRYNESPEIQVKNCDILMSKIEGRVGYVESLSEPSTVNSSIVVIRILNDSVFPKFLYYYFLSEEYKEFFKKHKKGTTMSSINQETLKKFPINLPSFEIQRKIAAILDKAIELRHNDKIILKKYNLLSKSIFYDLFGDPFKNTKSFDVKSIGELSEKIQIGPFGTQLHKIDYINDGVPLINPTHIIDHKIVPDYNFTITNKKYKSLPNYHLKEGDIILGRRGEMGRSAIVTKKEEGWFCGTGSLYIRPNWKVNYGYLSFAISTDEGVRYLEKEAKGITMKNLNKSIIFNIKIGLPPIEMQNRFANIIEKIEAQKQLTIYSLQRSEELFQSLLHRAFRGELV